MATPVAVVPPSVVPAMMSPVVTSMMPTVSTAIIGDRVTDKRRRRNPRHR